MGILDNLLKNRFKAQSNMPHPVTNPRYRWVPNSGVDISIAEGEYGPTNPEFHLIQKRLDNPYDPSPSRDASVDGLVDLQTMFAQFVAQLPRLKKLLGDR